MKTGLFAASIFACAYSSTPDDVTMLQTKFKVNDIEALVDTKPRNPVSFFRQPEQRIISAYYQNQRDWHGQKPASDIREYAEGMAGCNVRMMTRGGKDCGMSPHPTLVEVESAVQQVKKQKFVGIADEFELSMCLFHKIYGGPCTDKDFANMRLDGTKQLSYNAEEIVPLFKDEYDGPLFNAALQRFWQLVKRYDVTRSSCEELCAEATMREPFAAILDWQLSFPQFEEGHVKRDTPGHSDPWAYDWPGRASYNID